MIVVVTTATHAYTHSQITSLVPSLRQTSYPTLLRRRRLPRATYLFTDFDRLGFWQLELAAHVFRALREAGCRVLNDPAAVIQRLPLIRRLHAAGINSFTAWPAEELCGVDRFPVFLRTRSAHRGVLTDLIGDADALAAECRRLVGEGYPLADLMAVEYRAAPIHGDVFRKLSVYRIGDAITPSASVHERRWAAKYGEPGVAGAGSYEEDLDIVRTNRFAEPARRVFELACVDYGRVDFGLVDGKPEYYEINTNPSLDLDGPQPPIAARAESIRIARKRLLAALADLDASDAGTVDIPVQRELARRSRRKRLWPGYSWVP